ncbi:hypothetical protein AB2M62_10345 [Sphingomonas sp. MMS12-HWE2-04]|uniref:hypothetical protein n=1 Tax=Sphingomonas sp. MMS12-HWE2-04 TaxID=3234199 RepID=UPI003850B27B
MRVLGRVVVLGGVLGLSACGGGGTTGTNYSDPPPMAEIVATPTPKPTPTPEASETPEAAAEDANVAAPAANEAVTTNAE